MQILLQGGYALSLQELLELAGPGYEAVGVVFGDEAARSLRDFLLARLRVFLLEQGYRYDLVDAVIASEDDRPLRIEARSAGSHRVYRLRRRHRFNDRF